jgi:hypothetical protein
LSAYSIKRLHAASAEAAISAEASDDESLDEHPTRVVAAIDAQMMHRFVRLNTLPLFGDLYLGK